MSKMTLINRACARRRATLLLGACILACPGLTQATTYTWNGSTTSGFGYLSENDNWVGGVAPSTGGPSDLIFGSINTHGFSPTATSAYTLNSLTFNSSALAFTINGGPLTINGGGVTDSSANSEKIGGNTSIILGASQTWNVAAGQLTVNNDALTNSTSSTLTKIGSGTLNFALSTSSASSITSLQLNAGLTQISSGTLNTANATGSAVALSTGASLNISGGAVVNGNASAVADLDLNNNSSVLITGAGSQFNATDYQILISSGTLAVASTGSASASVGLAVGLSGSSALNVSSGGTVSAPAVILSQGTSGNGSASIDGPGSVLTASTELYLGGYLGVPGGIGTLSITNGGKVNTLLTQLYNSAANISINGGSLNTGGLNGSYGTVTVANPTVGYGLNINGSSGTSTYSGILQGTGTINKTGGSTQIFSSLTLTGGLSAVAGGGALVVNGTTDIEAGSALFVSGGTFTVNGGLTGGITSSQVGLIQLTDPTTGFALTVNQSGGTSTCLATIMGTGSVVKNGLGYEALDGLNSFTGQVIVNTGTLEMATGTASMYQASYGTLILDSAVNSATATVGTGGVLTGSGNYSNVTLTAGGTFAPGFSFLGSPQFGSTGVVTPGVTGATTSNAVLILTVPTTFSVVNATDTLTLGGSFTATNQSLTRTGAGTLILAGPYTDSAVSFSLQGGTTQIAQGLLQLNSGTIPLSVQGGAVFNISAGASVFDLNSSTNSYIDGNGSVNVTGSPSLLKLYNVTVGNASQGSLTVTSGANLTAAFLVTVGSANGSNGNFAVTNSGTASLLDLTIAKIAGSTGSATVDGPGSVLTATGVGGITIGGSSPSSTGTVSITNGGAVSVNTAVSFSGANSSLIVNGGTLTAGGLKSTVAGNGSVTLTDPAGGAALTLSTTLSTYNYSGSLVGNGSIYKTNGSDQILSGNNTAFTGVISVQGGILEMSASAMAYAEAYSGATLQLDYGNYGASSLVADPGGTVIYNASTVSGGVLLGGGTHNVSSVKLFSDTTISNGVTITPANYAQLFGVNNAGAILNPAGTVLFVSGSNAGGTLNVSGSTSISSWTSSGLLLINAGGTVTSGNSNLLLLGGSRTYVGTSSAPGGSLTLVGGTTIELNGGLLVNYGNISGGTLDINYGGLATGTHSYPTVNIGPGGTYLPGSYGAGSPALVLGSPNATIEPAASGITSTSTSITANAPVLLTVNGTDHLTLGSAIVTNNNPVTKVGSGTATLLPFASSSLNVSAGTLQLSPSTLVLQPTSLAVAAGAVLDTTSDSADIAGSTLASVNALVTQGYNSGRWNGSGIVSSTAAASTSHLTAIGVIQNNQSGPAIYNSSHPFEGVTPGAGDVLLKYTYYGDTNLDGKVDGSDYSRIDAAYLADKTNPATDTGWFNGDFNYDGVINGSDYTLIDNAFNTQGALLASAIANPDAIATAQLAGAPGGSSVPEPGTVGMLVLAASAASLRRRPRQL